MSNTPVIKTDGTKLPDIPKDIPVNTNNEQVPFSQTPDQVIPEPTYQPMSEPSLIKPEVDNSLLKDSSVDASNFLTGKEGASDQSLGLTSTLQAIERKEQPILTYTDQGVQATTAQQSSTTTTTNPPPKDDDDNTTTGTATPKQQLFTRLLNTLVGYKVTATAVKEYNSWAQQDPKNSNTWLATWIKMVGDKIDKIL